MTEVYYIEDDVDIGAGVKQYLESRECVVSIYTTAAAARSALLKRQPSIVLLDWNLPDGIGLDLCTWLRSRWEKLPVIFLTVKGDSKEIVEGFQNGADDYVVKPFELEILYTRMCALLRRMENTQEKKILTCDFILLDRERMRVLCYDSNQRRSNEETAAKEVSLSQQEYQLLLLLLENKGRTIPRERLLEQIWDSNGNFVNDNTLTVTMKRLREKLGMPKCIKTIRSFGYCMEDTL